MSVSNLYLGRLPEDPAREYSLAGESVASFALRCPVSAAPPGVGRPGETSVLVAVQATGALAEEVLGQLRAGDRVLVAGSLAASPPDPDRLGASDVLVHAQHVGLDLDTGGWHRDPVPVRVGETAPTGHPEYHW
ncbi:hypothetical protein Athai_42980 [Actinocatenispora thailandica]|uniref:Single-stranded DNA-binding protein n=1 Tax=Actinocatenispora thailandica TaxID=227318 RepID=A0A7R7DRY0_9ACTN|nr:single-stranded DNA-binding protein [Actinocatenispora thailandica]BCJ36795.1 hypothetical protein Athai_42980 [Actinocatenispora thailandica]